MAHPLLTNNTPEGYYVIMESKIKRQVIRRLKIVSGQIKGLEKMVTRGKYCIDIIYQSLAIKQALSSLEDLILKNHLSTHVIQQIKGGKETKAIREVLSIYKLSKRK